jgi:hypothetical protein
VYAVPFLKFVLNFGIHNGVSLGLSSNVTPTSSVPSKSTLHNCDILYPGKRSSSSPFFSS